MHRCSAFQVGQGEGGLAVAAVGRAQQREQRRVLRQRQQLAVAPRPPLWREVEREYADLGNEWVGHEVLSGGARKNTEQRNDEADAEIRLKVRVRLTAADRAYRRRMKTPYRRVGAVRQGVHVRQGRENGGLRRTRV